MIKPISRTSKAEVSVIIPTYCRPDDLSELLNSLLHQSMNPLEIIVVDDTPSSAIQRVCDSYTEQFKKADVTFVYVRNDRERSIAIARNTGAKVAKGDLLMFLDDDVVLRPDYIENVLETFEKFPKALGVGGWIVPLQTSTDLTHYLFDSAFRKLFLLWHDSKDSCNFAEYPTNLTKVISCKWTSGSNLTVEPKVFSELRFDESLRDYAFMEDVLFSASLNKKYPNRLVMTPYAKCIHKVSREARLTGSRMRQRAMQNRKYVQTRLFGYKGLLMFGWQNVGLLIYRLVAKIRKWEVVAVI